MTVTGNEQRVYGTLMSGCFINLHRFAIVKDGTHSPSDIGAPVLFGDNQTYAKVMSCSYLYAGYFTIRFILVEQADKAEAIFEVRQCKKGLKYLFIETYGERITAGFSLTAWFNKGSNTNPDWIKLNDNLTTAWLEYKEYVTSFNERATSGLYEVLCCKDCPTTCTCISCNVASRFAFRTSSGLLNPLPTNPSSPGLGPGGTPVFRNYGITNNGDNSYLWEDGGGSTLDLYVEYKILCNAIEIWAGDYHSHLFWDYSFYLDDANVWHLLSYSGGGVLAPGYIGTFPFNYLKNCRPSCFGFMYDCGPNPTVFEGTVSYAANFTGNTVHFAGTNGFTGDITYTCSNRKVTATASLSAPFEQDTSGALIDFGTPDILSHGNCTSAYANADGTYYMCGVSGFPGGHAYWRWDNILQIGHRYSYEITIDHEGSYYALTLIYFYPPISNPEIWIYEGINTLSGQLVYRYYKLDQPGFSMIDIELNAGGYWGTGKMTYKFIEVPYYTSLWYLNTSGTWVRLIVSANNDSNTMTIDM